VRGCCGAILVLAGLAGCTTYQPVAWNGQGSWAEARQLGPRSSAVVAAVGLQHKVRYGETLSEIASQYRVPLHTVATLNGIGAPYPVQVGQVLVLPAAASEIRSVPVVTASRPAPKAAPVAVRDVPVPTIRAGEVQVASLGGDHLPSVLVRPIPPGRSPKETPAHASPPSLSGNGFLWPVRGRIASAFGSKPNGTRNDGINIRAPVGTPVLAAENGVVVYASDEIPGYGRMLLISHANGFLTAYAHNSKLLVDVGDHVDRGQRIAAVGSTGNVTSPQLHFEIRDGKKALDPVALLDAAVTQVASVE
jgi:murein DD-endopeptidase MepM/ murein hydrolase activator NlpD